MEENQIKKFETKMGSFHCSLFFLLLLHASTSINIPQIVPEDLADQGVEAVYSARSERTNDDAYGARIDNRNDQNVDEHECKRDESNEDVERERQNAHMAMVEGDSDAPPPLGSGNVEENTEVKEVCNDSEKAKIQGDVSLEMKFTPRTQLVIPISSSCSELTPRLLQRFFAVRGVAVQQVILALVDGNATVSRCCLYNYIQAPLEGPGTAILQLLSD